ncbi:MAG: twin-arginine translocase TatA/TatE family subunit [Dehalococcoidia bacterium]|nr:MAG: twin-arginine translocase TatA/TatE family subunit [Dehalococcoidia bacterium]
MELFGVGPLEALLVGVIAFLVVGPDRFPELARQAGKWYRVARAFTADVMSDVQGAVKELEAEVDASTGGLRSIRELTEAGSILSEARADVETATSSVQAVVETSAVSTEPAPTQAVPVFEAAASAVTSPSEASASASVNPAPQPSSGAHGDPFDAAEVKRREAAAREAAARITGGSV